MKLPAIVAALALLCASCTDNKSPLAPTTVASPTPTVATPPLPTTVPGVLSVGMPIETGDSANTVFGIGPYGYHGADHAEDGHPGWDIEYRVGGIVRAAAAGRVMSVFADAFTSGRTTVQLEHIVGAHHYRTVYTNIATVAADIVVDATVRAGQSLGPAGTISGTVGARAVTYAMTHFQLDDFEYYREVPNPNAVSPEPFLTAEARGLFDALWTRAHYSQELIESFATNPRELTFPASRTWMRAGGDGPAGIRFGRRSARSPDYEYALLAESGVTIEAGTVTLALTARPYPTIDLISPTSRRLGIYDVVSNQMRLALANAGAQRPADLSNASVYRMGR